MAAYVDPQHAPAHRKSAEGGTIDHLVGAQVSARDGAASAHGMASDSPNQPPQAQSLLQMRQALDEGPRVQSQLALQRALNRPGAGSAQAGTAEASPQLPSAPAQRKPNRTGLPDRLKAGVENLSGLAMDDVRVHYNSAKPTTLQALAYAQGTDIHIAPGQEKHQPHEAWHVVQQKQGRVKPTLQLKRGIWGNDDAGLEQEADVMGARAENVQPGHVPPVHGITAAQLVAIVQRIPVNDSDIGADFEITTTESIRTVGTLQTISGGGWYRFQVGGNEVYVRGQANIHRRITDDRSDNSSEMQDDDGEEDLFESSDEKSHEAMGVGYSTGHEPTNQSEFDIAEVARRKNISVLEATMLIRNSFQIAPRTLRLHYPFGSKTVSSGAPAFRTPDESKKEPQAMVNYRVGDYEEHKKVGKDYDVWADSLSDDEESEETKQARAKMMIEFLENNESLEFDDLSGRQKAALAGLFSVALLSDPLRTEFNSRRTETDFMDRLRARARGETTFHQIFGSKTDSSFLPARKGGSAQQREQLRDRTREELSGEARLWQNNCLINAICQAAYRRNATMEELMTIRFNLNNVGAMMVAHQGTINIIRHVLDINSGIMVRYPVDSGNPDEPFDGIDPWLEIFHTGGDHFQNDCPNPESYSDADPEDYGDDYD
jgi:hypothetical protein